MSTDTHGKIKGFVRHEEIFNFIRQKWDKNAIDQVTRTIINPISEITWRYKLNEHSEDNDNWYNDSGFICFTYKDEKRMLFYCYDNINSFENESYYNERNLHDMIQSETTYLSLGYWGSSIEIIKEIISHFGGGWIDEDDCDDNEYYPIKLNEDGNIIPIKYVTMDEIYEKFGCVVVIKNN